MENTVHEDELASAPNLEKIYNAYSPIKNLSYQLKSTVKIFIDAYCQLKTSSIDLSQA